MTKKEIAAIEKKLKTLIAKNPVKDVIEDIAILRQQLMDCENYDITSISFLIKDKVQKEACEAIGSNSAIAAMATGSGKSKVGVMKSQEVSGKILVVVPTEKLRDENWKEEFSKWGASEVYDTRVDRSCYASISKIENESYDLVILDEGHNITENNIIPFLQQNQVKQSILLTATLPKDPVKIEILKDIGLEPAYTLSLDESVSLGLVAPYKITVVELSLDSTNKTIKSGTKDKPFMQTELQKYGYLDTVVKKLMYSTDLKAKATLKFKILDRMRFIYNLPTKLEAAKLLLNMIPKEDRTLIFCSGIEQADLLCENSYHSKSKNDEAFVNFKSGEIDRMSCVNSLNEGHNIDTGVDIALIVQANSSDKNLIQRAGRILRFRNGHIGHIIILMVTNTVDEKWVKSALESFNRENVSYVRLANIVSGNTPLFDN